MNRIGHQLSTLPATDCHCGLWTLPYLVTIIRMTWFLSRLNNYIYIYTKRDTIRKVCEAFLIRQGNWSIQPLRTVAMKCNLSSFIHICIICLCHHFRSSCLHHVVITCNFRLKSVGRPKYRNYDLVHVSHQFLQYILIAGLNNPFDLLLNCLSVLQYTVKFR